MDQLIGAGWEVGGHTHRHYNMLALTEAECAEEITASNHLIERKAGIMPKVFAYPYGAFDARVAGIVRCHYSAAVATERGGRHLEKDRWTLRRSWPAILPDHLKQLFDGREISED